MTTIFFPFSNGFDKTDAILVKTEPNWKTEQRATIGFPKMFGILALTVSLNCHFPAFNIALLTSEFG